MSNRGHTCQLIVSNFILNISMLFSDMLFKRLCIRIGHYGAIQMLYYYYYYYYL